MKDNQYQTEITMMRYRSCTVATASNLTREFPEMEHYGAIDNTDDDTDTLDKADSENSVFESPSQSRKSHSLESRDSLSLIKQRRDYSLWSMFHQTKRMVYNRRGGEEHPRPTIKGRSISAPTNGLKIDYGTIPMDNKEAPNSQGIANELNQEVFDIEPSRAMNEDKRVKFYREALLHDAIQRDDLNELCDLLNKNKDIDLELPDSFGITPLHRAAIEGSYRCMNLLLTRNVNVKVRDIYGWTPLHDAVYHGNIRCAAALITAGSNVEAETNDFTTPVEMAHEDEMLLLVGRAMTSPGYVYDPDRETLV